MLFAVLWPAVLGALVAIAHAKPSPTVRLSKRAPSSPLFVSTENGHFVVNGSKLNFVGTNAYWLPTLSDDDIEKTLEDIASAGIKVVRTWAFNDVTDIPATGTWFQQIKDGKFLLNQGANGLQRLDKVVELAQKHGIYLVLSLTNNWNIGSSIGWERNASIPRNTLSNDYGGMDVYVRDLGLEDHDKFYTDDTLVNSFKNYTTGIVSRYLESTSVFAWELANDPRCNSTLPAGECNPQDITKWHATISEHIRSIDTNHLLSAGSGGFLCLDCPKLFPLVRPPTPQPSSVPGAPRRRAPQFLTKAKFLKKRAELSKNRSLQARGGGGGMRIRGTWKSTPTRRQSDTQEVGSAFDGSRGVDSQDILNIPNLDFGSFQLFPDQNSYGPDDSNLSPYENAVAQGNSWINVNAESAADFGKPITLNAFGLVTEDSLRSFVPFAGPSAAFGLDPGTIGATDDQLKGAYGAWLKAGLDAGLEGAIQYQWGQSGLTISPGTPITSSSGTSSVAVSPGSTGFSPNDGYSIIGQVQQGAIETIQQAVASFAPDT